MTMHFSPAIKSSHHCLPSPDGRSVATLLTGRIIIRTVETLDVARTVKLPADLAGSIANFIWSPNSEKILLSTGDEIHVFSATDGDYHATIRNPSPSPAKSSFVDFGATEKEACVYSAHGIKLSLFNLASAKVVEISNPKFYTASSAPRGFSFRPYTHHLALLTRTSGKDAVSIHAAGSRDVQRSWNPDLVDTQGLSWAPNGRWLVMWESPSQGHRLVFFTPDGHKYRDWCGPLRTAPDDMQDRLAAGIKSVVFSPDSQYIAVGDFSPCISILPTANMTHELQLCLPLTIEPKDTLQVWQEKLDGPDGQGSGHQFIRATQPTAPAVRAPSNGHELKSGPLFILFDQSAALLAVSLEDAPSTLWIWDVTVSELRAVLMFHAEISRIQWHPFQSELLLVKCEGPDHSGVVFIWDPLSDGPRVMDFRSHLPGGKISGKSSACWLQTRQGPPSVFFSESRSFLLATDADVDEEEVPWQMCQPSLSADRSQAARSSMASARESDVDMGEDASHLDDTFYFKKFGVD